MEKCIDALMEHAEESLKAYSKMQDWHPEEVEKAYRAAKLYETLQTIKMNDGIWGEMQGDGQTSHGYRMPHLSYRDGMHSEMRGRDAATGRFMSRADGQPVHDVYYDDRMHSNRGRSMHSIKDRAIDALERMIDTAQTDHERQKIEGFINMIERGE